MRKDLDNFEANESAVDSQEADPVESKSSSISRRSALKLAFGAGTAAAMTSVITAFPEQAFAEVVGPQSYRERKRSAMKLRNLAASIEFAQRDVVQECNGDEQRYDDFRTSFHKTLPQNSLGEVDPLVYRAYLKNLAAADEEQFALLPLDPLSDRKLANPFGAYAFELLGLDSHSSYMGQAPEFAGVEVAAEMGELYWQSLTRDIPFARYEASQLVAAASSDLNQFSKTVGPKNQAGLVDPSSIFRGETSGDLVGPYVSQFLQKDIPYGPSLIKQRYQTPVRNENFMTDYDEWLAIQKGANPVREISTYNNLRYIYNSRALAAYVHSDVLFQAYFNTALIIGGFGQAALDGNNPYLASTNQSGFVSFGFPEVVHTVCAAGRMALTAAWYQKWLVHRLLRPEVFGGRLENQINGSKDYGINDELASSAGVQRTRNKYGNSLLPQAYPEGSPTHPSLPAGHAVVAGACSTVLKAWFHEDFPIPDPVVASRNGRQLEPYSEGDLRLGDEINKLANNISIGRNMAGVHYRSDGVFGMNVGEQMALGLLRDYSLTHKEKFDGFQLTKFDGSRIRIKRGKILRER